MDEPTPGPALAVTIGGMVLLAVTAANWNPSGGLEAPLGLLFQFAVGAVAFILLVWGHGTALERGHRVSSWMASIFWILWGLVVLYAMHPLSSSFERNWPGKVLGVFIVGVGVWSVRKARRSGSSATPRLQA